jgi:deoxycytidylate deaminase
MITARMSACRFQMGCIIVKGSRILSVATNVIKTHPTRKNYGDHCISIHAELNAILLAQTDVVGATAYVARVNGTQSSMPCPTCQMYLKQSGISRAIYWNNEIKVLEL